MSREQLAMLVSSPKSLHLLRKYRDDVPIGRLANISYVTVSSPPASFEATMELFSASFMPSGIL